MLIAEIALLWEGTLALCIIIGTYITKQWYKTHIGRFILSMKVALGAAYVRPVIRSIVNPDGLVVGTTSLVYLGIFAILLTYGAYAFVSVSRKSPTQKPNNEGKDHDTRTPEERSPDAPEHW